MRRKKLILGICIAAMCLSGCSGTVTSSVDEVQTSNGVLPTKIIENVNYEKYFDGLNGCAVFYEMGTEKYYIYNREISEERESPCSTFKIITTLMGLHEGVLTDIDTTMGYDGTKYPMEMWNDDLGLKDAFKTSCVWYFRKVIDKIGEEKVQKYLDDLNFGNCDISKWNGTGEREPKDLNGFWLGSSLEISPMEWINVLQNIWSGNTIFTKDEVKMLKQVMATADDSGVTVYGKTGTSGPDKDGNVDNGWYVGEFENKDKKYCFALHLTKPGSKEVSGPKAQSILSSIIQNEYITYK